MFKNVTKIICIILALCLLSGCSLVTTNKTEVPEEKFSEKENVEKDGEVTIVVKALGEQIFKGTVPLSEGMSAFDATLLFAEQEEIEVMHKNSYIQKLGDYREKDYGPSSGWLYYINGESAMVACADYKVSAGDEITWKYVKDFSEEE